MWNQIKTVLLLGGLSALMIGFGGAMGGECSGGLRGIGDRDECRGVLLLGSADFVDARGAGNFGRGGSGVAWNGRGVGHRGEYPEASRLRDS